MKHYFYSIISLMLISFILNSKVFTPADTQFTLHRTDTTSQPETAVVYAHGIAATQHQGIKHFARVTGRNVDNSFNYNKYWLFDEPIALFNFPDAKPGVNQYLKEYVNLGQTLDQERLHEAYVKTLQELPSCKTIIGCGISRGAATWLTYMATYKSTAVGALILESPFDTVKSIINHLMAKVHIGWLPFSTSFGLWLSQHHFPLLDVHGSFPIDIVDSIPTDLAILLVHSKNDEIIPINSSRKLYKQLIQSGHDHVYLLELARGYHGKLIDDMEGELYQNIAHAFLQKYNLPHCPAFAQQGIPLLAQCQPSLDEINIRIKKKRNPTLIDDEFDKDTDTIFEIDDELGSIKVH